MLTRKLSWNQFGVNRSLRKGSSLLDIFVVAQILQLSDRSEVSSLFSQITEDFLMCRVAKIIAGFLPWQYINSGNHKQSNLYIKRQRFWSLFLIWDFHAKKKRL